MSGKEMPTLDDFESHLMTLLRINPDAEESATALHALESIRLFRKDYEQVKDHLR